MCSVLDIPRSTYYDQFNRNPLNRTLEKESFKQLILKIYLTSKKRYGASKITEKLKSLGHKISIKRVQRLMRSLNIRTITQKKFKNYSKTSNYQRGKNLLNINFKTTRINQKWAKDITYIQAKKDGCCYLDSVMDLFTKKIIEYSFSKNMESQLTIYALTKAYKQQRPEKEVIIHSDRGSQFISSLLRNKVKELGLVQSFSNKGNPYDNAVIESLYATLKKKKLIIENIIV